MATNEDTIYDGGNNGREETEIQSNHKVHEASGDNQSGHEGGGLWKKVTIGSAAGILLGVGGAYAVNAYNNGAFDHMMGNDPSGHDASGNNPHSATAAAHHTAANGLNVADVNDSQSFHEAFDSARAAVGPGGVFHWHGGIYSTYSTEEWDHMSADQHSAYAQQVKPEVRSGEEHTGEAHQHDAFADVNVHHSGNDDVSVHHTSATAGNEHGAHVASEDGPQGEVDPDVQIVGVHDVQTEDGSLVTVGVAEVSGHDVYVVDVNHDGTFDVAYVDANNNGHMDQNEIHDISDQHLTVGDMTNSEHIDTGGDIPHDDPSMHMASNDMPTDDGLGDGMPDYVNDADNAC